MLKQVSIAVMMFLMLGVNGVMAGTPFYNLGKNLGTSLGRSVWNDFGRNSNKCAHTDEFISIIKDSTVQAERYMRTMKRSSIEDFASGYIQGITKILAVVASHCQNECIDMGIVAGQLTSTIFCATSKNLGRTATFKGYEDIPAFICGNAYRSKCESNFYREAKNQCPSYAIGYSFKTYYKSGLGGCCQYNIEDQKW